MFNLSIFLSVTYSSSIIPSFLLITMYLKKTERQRFYSHRSMYSQNLRRHKQLKQGLRLFLSAGYKHIKEPGWFRLQQYLDAKRISSPEGKAERSPPTVADEHQSKPSSLMIHAFRGCCGSVPVGPPACPKFLKLTEQLCNILNGIKEDKSGSKPCIQSS